MGPSRSGREGVLPGAGVEVGSIGGLPGVAPDPSAMKRFDAMVRMGKQWISTSTNLTVRVFPGDAS